MAAALRGMAWLLLGPMLYLGRGPARILLFAFGLLGIMCGFAGVLGIHLALDAGQSLGEPLLMIWSGGALGGCCFWLRARIPRMWSAHD